MILDDILGNHYVNFLSLPIWMVFLYIYKKKTKVRFKDLIININ